MSSSTAGPMTLGSSGCGILNRITAASMVGESVTWSASSMTIAFPCGRCFLGRSGYRRFSCHETPNRSLSQVNFLLNP
jgi:hypothetical protein